MSVGESPEQPTHGFSSESLPSVFENQELVAKRSEYQYPVFENQDGSKASKVVAKRSEIVDVTLTAAHDNFVNSDNDDKNCHDGPNDGNTDESSTMKAQAMGPPDWEIPTIQQIERMKRYELQKFLKEKGHCASNRCQKKILKERLLKIYHYHEPIQNAAGASGKSTVGQLTSCKRREKMLERTSAVALSWERFCLAVADSDADANKGDVDM